MSAEMERARKLLSHAKRPVAFTGAGMSADSGIATFRGSDDSLWSRYSPESLATPGAFIQDRALVWAWYVWRMGVIANAVSNAGHLALAKAAARWPELAVVTQNVDNLHERAGSINVSHLHGNIFAPRCFSCARPYTDFEVPKDILKNPSLRLDPPRCDNCGGHVRPGVVWFGESLPEDDWRIAEMKIRDCDLLLVVGTSGVVEPAASLVALARRHGARIVLVDPQESAHASLADIHIRDTASTALPDLFNPLKNPA